MRDARDPLEQWMAEDAQALAADSAFTARVLNALPAPRPARQPTQTPLLLAAYSLLGTWLCAAWPALEPAWQQGGDAALGPGLVLTTCAALLLWWTAPGVARR